MSQVKNRLLRKCNGHGLAKNNWPDTKKHRDQNAFRLNKIQTLKINTSQKAIDSDASFPTLDQNNNTVQG